jgi:hypothetical protein
LNLGLYACEAVTLLFEPLALVILEMGSYELFAQAGLEPPLISASQVAGIIGMRHQHPELFFEMGFYCVTQAGLKVPDPSDPASSWPRPLHPALSTHYNLPPLRAPLQLFRAWWGWEEIIIQ